MHAPGKRRLFDMMSTVLLDDLGGEQTDLQRIYWKRLDDSSDVDFEMLRLRRGEKRISRIREGSIPWLDDCVFFCPSTRLTHASTDFGHFSRLVCGGPLGTRTDLILFTHKSTEMEQGPSQTETAQPHIHWVQ